MTTADRVGAVFGMVVCGISVGIGTGSIALGFAAFHALLVFAYVMEGGRKR